jgi:hypothetical protein
MEIIRPFSVFTLNGAEPTLRAMNQPTHTRPIHTIRWENFRALLADRALTITAAAEALGKPQGQVSHFGGKNPTKIIGDQIAGEIEAAFSLPAGWLDVNRSDHATGDELVKINPPFRGEMRPKSQFDESIAPMLAQAEQWVRFEEEAKRRAGIQPWGTDPVSKAVRRAERLIALTQLLSARGGTLRPEEAAAIIDAARQSGEPETDGKAATRGRSKHGSSE